MSKECVHTQLHEAEVIDFTQDSEYIRLFGKKKMKTIKEKMLEANKARTDLLSNNPEINTKWTPDAVGIMEVSKADKRDLSEEAEDEILKSTGKIDCVHTKLYKAQAELIDLWVEEEEKRLPPKPPMSPFS